jgi:Flp pilus assembly pilin Flp
MAGRQHSATSSGVDWRHDDGATSVEYAIMCVLVAVAIVTTVGLLGEALHALFGDPTLMNALTP